MKLNGRRNNRTTKKDYDNNQITNNFYDQISMFIIKKKHNKMKNATDKNKNKTIQPMLH